MEKWNWLQLMAEGAEGAAAADAGSPEQDAEETAQAEQQPETEDLEAEFDALVKKDGKFREVFGKRVQSAVQARSRSMKATVERYNSFAPALEVLAARYGMSVDDPGLAGKIAGDKQLLENMAMENGTSADVEFELAKARAAQQRAEGLVQQIMADREMQSWMQQAEDMKAEHPDFDLDTEMQNPEFQKLLRNGVTMEGAYLALHFNDVKSRMAANAEKKVTDAVAAGARRPRENGMGSAAGASVGADPMKLSKAEFEDYLKRIERGERVSFSK